MTTFERLQNILIADYPLTREALTLDALLENLDIDSLGLVELMFSIEKEFNIIVPNDRVELKMIGDVVHYINQLVAEQQVDSISSRAA
ncbi:MAG: phosphopantetheine-binding protein [Pseudomonadota bacterium]